jgi:hypothetical protein
MVSVKFECDKERKKCSVRSISTFVVLVHQAEHLGPFFDSSSQERQVKIRKPQFFMAVIIGIVSRDWGRPLMVFWIDPAGRLILI